MFLHLDGNYFEITPETFVIPTNMPDKCLLAFTSSSDMEFWLLGNAFMLNFYTIWDEENARIGLAPAIKSKSSVIKNAPLPLGEIKAVIGKDLLEDFKINGVSIVLASVGYVGVMGTFLI